MTEGDKADPVDKASDKIGQSIEYMKQIDELRREQWKATIEIVKEIHGIRESFRATAEAGPVAKLVPVKNDET
jgi:hypothetical protein